MIYFIQSGDHVKVGYTSNMKNRYKQYVTENPNPVKLIGQCKGGFDIEKKIHKQLIEYKHNREWFHLNDESAALIRIIIKENADNEEPKYKKQKKVTKGYMNTYLELIRNCRSTGILDLTVKLRTEIAENLGVTIQTVNKHVNLLLKTKKLSRVDTLYYLT